MKRLLAAIALACLAACAAAPQSDGGIVGTGNRIECEGQADKECKRQGIR